MKNKKWIIGIVILLAILGVIVYFMFFRNTNTTPESNYNPSKISYNTTLADGGNSSNNNLAGSDNANSNSIDSDNSNNLNPKTETKISSFTTPIVDDHKNRINNIKITCSRISDTIVKPDEEFSFCEVVGQPSSSDGYKEAHAFVDGKLVNAIGGGNCQVSTTLYNAAKKIDGVKITERHEHGKEVGYIEKGKDATVAYDYLDLKFENNNDFDLKLQAYIKNDKVCVDIYKIA